MQLQFANPTADFWTNQHLPVPVSSSEITHLGIGAHHDDLEFMALHGILECYHDENRWFAGVTCTDGSGSVRNGPFAGVSPGELRDIRREEQRTAAEIGQYAFQAQLDYTSEAAKKGDPGLQKDLVTILEASRPDIVYTHNFADKHPTHVAVAAAVINAIRTMEAGARPKSVYGCEVWRSLDWLSDSDKVILPIEDPGKLGEKLRSVYRSQIDGGKRYDLAVAGRLKANATFLSAHEEDGCKEAWYAMDLTPLIQDTNLSVRDFIESKCRQFREDVLHLVDQLTN